MKSQEYQVSIWNKESSSAKEELAVMKQHDVSKAMRKLETRVKEIMKRILEDKKRW